MRILFMMIIIVLFFGCKKSSAPVEPKINFIFRFDSTQARLNSVGQPSVIPTGNAAQSPVFNTMSAHYLELAPADLTPLGGGEIVYRADETIIGGANAIDFSKAKLAGNNEIFLSVPVKDLAAGSYKWLRVSLAYQNYNIKFRAAGFDLGGTIASFIGFNTYIGQYKIKDSTVSVNSNKMQGYWGFETSVSGFGNVSTGQAPANATTVTNPIFASSPVPQGSCVVTGRFDSPLLVTGTETSDINIIVSLSVNKSFEWLDVNGNGIFEPTNGDQVQDMGIRGLIPSRL